MSKTLLIGILSIVGLAALVPFGLIAFSRSRPSNQPPVHPILDMDKQPKFKSQRENPMFADGRAMRPVLPGTVAREDLRVVNEVLNDPEFPAGWTAAASPTCRRTRPRTSGCCRAPSGRPTGRPGT